MLTINKAEQFNTSRWKSIAACSKSSRSAHGHSMLQTCPTAIQMGACEQPALFCSNGRAKWLPQLPGTWSSCCHPQRVSLLMGSALEGPCFSTQKFWLKNSPQKSRLTIFLDQGFKANFHCANAEWNSSPHPTAAWTKRHLCINQLPYFGNGARSGSSVNASRDLSATKSLQQSAIAAITKSRALGHTGAHVGSDGADAGKWTWMMHQAGRKAVKGYKCPTALFLRISIFSITFMRKL